MSNGCVCHVRVHGIIRGGIKMFDLWIAFLILGLCFGIYMLPSIVAYLFKHKNVNAITVLNLCLGRIS